MMATRVLGLIILILSTQAIGASECLQSDLFQYCVGDNVINIREDEAVITGIDRIHEKLSVQMKHGRSSSVWFAKETAVTNGCLKDSRFCTGTSVFTEDGKKAKIAGVFQDTNVLLKADTSELFYYSASKLALKEGCTSSGFCVGDIVTIRNNDVFIVKQEVIGVYPGTDDIVTINRPDAYPFITYRKSSLFFVH